MLTPAEIDKVKQQEGNDTRQEHHDQQLDSDPEEQDISSNKSDLTVHEKETNRCVIIDVAIPSHYNIQKKATEKMSKYIDLQIECQGMWNKKVEVIPVIIGQLG